MPLCKALKKASFAPVFVIAPTNTVQVFTILELNQRLLIVFDETAGVSETINTTNRTTL